MEWNEKLQLIIDYVENHLQRKEEAVVSEEISKTAGCSFAFFLKGLFIYEQNQLCGLYSCAKINFSRV